MLLTGVILSFYGGGFATVPAYLKDLFGTLQVGAIHGRLLTAWSAAGIAGPLIVNAIADSEGAAGKSGADLYTLSLYIMVGVLIVGFVANLLIRPVKDRYMEPEEGTGRFRREPAPAPPSPQKGADPWSPTQSAASRCGSSCSRRSLRRREHAEQRRRPVRLSAEAGGFPP